MIKAVWGRIQGRDAVQVEHDGNRWRFQVPTWATSPIIAEFWAEDEAGNVSYATGVFTIEEGAIKCIRWREEGSRLTMLADGRPSVTDAVSRSHAWEIVSQSTATLGEGRSHAEMLAHTCPKMEAVL